MTNPRALVMTGASGTVGHALAEQLAASLPGPIRAFGHTPPAGLRSGDRFERADLSDPAAVTRAARRIAAGPSAAGLVCAAGTECRACLAHFDPVALAYCLQVNCTAHLQLFIVRLPDISIPMRAAAPGSPSPPRTSARRQLPIFSSAAWAAAGFICDPPADGLETWHA